MKKVLSFLFAMSLIPAVAGISNVALIDNFDRTITQTKTDVLRLMWLKDASYADSIGHGDSLRGGAGIHWSDLRAANSAATLRKQPTIG